MLKQFTRTDVAEFGTEVIDGSESEQDEDKDNITTDAMIKTKSSTRIVAGWMECDDCSHLSLLLFFFHAYKRVSACLEPHALLFPPVSKMGTTGAASKAKTSKKR